MQTCVLLYLNEGNLFQSQSSCTDASEKYAVGFWGLVAQASFNKVCLLGTTFTD